MEEDKTCSICLNNYKNKTRLDCGHCFCLTCINNWMKENNNCPFCRNIIMIENKEEYYNEYIEILNNVKEMFDEIISRSYVKAKGAEIKDLKQHIKSITNIKNNFDLFLRLLKA